MSWLQFNDYINAQTVIRYTNTAMKLTVHAI
jgi:hypothetical protein